MTPHTQTWSSREKDRRSTNRAEWFEALNGFIAIVLMVGILCAVFA